MKKPMIPIAVLGIATSTAFAAPPAQQLDKTAWQIVTLNGKPAEGDARIEFARGQISGGSGCNGFSGTYARHGDVLIIKEIIATQMGCGEKLNNQEKAVFGLLGPNVRLRFGQGGLLYVNSGKHSAVLRRAATCKSCNPPPVPLPLPSLPGTKWAIVTLNGKPLSQADQGDINFAADGLSATVGCNRMRATYRIGKVEYIVTGQFISTRMGCLGEVDKEERILGQLLADDPWMQRISKRNAPITLRLSSGANEAIITKRD